MTAALQRSSVQTRFFDAISRAYTHARTDHTLAKRIVTLWSSELANQARHKFISVIASARIGVEAAAQLSPLTPITMSDLLCTCAAALPAIDAAPLVLFNM
jgi:hypothetical protein